MATIKLASLEKWGQKYVCARACVQKATLCICLSDPPRETPRDWEWGAESETWGEAEMRGLKRSVGWDDGGERDLKPQEKTSGGCVWGNREVAEVPGNMYLKGVPWRFLMRWKEVSVGLIRAESRCGEGWFEFMHDSVWRCYSPNLTLNDDQDPSAHTDTNSPWSPTSAGSQSPPRVWSSLEIKLLISEAATSRVQVFI